MSAGNVKIISSDGGLWANAYSTLKAVFHDPTDASLILVDSKSTYLEDLVQHIEKPNFSETEDALEKALADATKSLQKLAADEGKTDQQKIAKQVEIADDASDALASIAASIPDVEHRSPSAEALIVRERGSRSRGGVASSQGFPAEVAAKRQIARRSPKQIPVAANFKLIFISVLVLTLLASVAFIALAVLVQAPTASQTSAIETTRTLMIAGFGVIFGLLGGKSIQ